LGPQSTYHPLGAEWRGGAAQINPFFSYYLNERSSRDSELLHWLTVLYMKLVSQAREMVERDAENHAAEVSRMEERLQAGESAYSELAERLKQCENALKGRESVRFICWARKLLGLKNLRI
jgi:hypothetical protein